MAIRTPTVKCTIKGKEFRLTELTVVSQVNGIATARVCGHYPDAASATQASVKLDLATASKQAGELQTYVTETSRLKPDLVLSGSDGAGGAVNFNGFITGPGVALQNGSYNLTCNALHEAAILDMFEGRAYRAYNLLNGQANTEAMNPVQILAFSGSIANRVSQILGSLITQYNTDSTPANDKLTPDEQAIAKALAQRNETLIPLIKKILANSDEHTKYDELSDLNGVDTQLKDYFCRMITSDGSFLDAVVSVLCPSFSLLFTCDIIGKNVATMARIDYANMQAVPLEIPVESAGFESGDRFSLPLGAVIVTSAILAGPVIQAASIEKATNQMSCVLGVYPRPLVPKSGFRIASVAAPDWMQTYLRTGQVDNTPWFSPTSSIKEFTDTIDKDGKVVKGEISKYQKFLDAWASNKFAYLQLLGSSASINIPLNFNVQAGLCYAVSTTGTKGVFTGFASQVTHTLKIDGKSGLAVTSILFTHIRAYGFVTKGSSPAAGSLYTASTSLGGPSGPLTSSGGITANSSL